MDTEEIRQGLERIGLSSYQSRAYTTLLEHGALPAVEVAKRSSIPTSRIYDVLTDLEREGYIETFERADKRHARTTEPSDVVDGLRHASEHLSTTAERIEEVWERESLEDHRLVLFEQVDSALDQAEALVGDATGSVFLAARPSQYYRLTEALAEARENGAVVHVSLEGIDPEPIDSDQPADEIRRRTIPGPFVVIVDRTHTCFAPNERAPETYGLVLDDEILSLILHWYFQTCLWSVYEPVYRRSGDDVHYVSAEAFVRDVYPFWRSGAIVPVTVNGTDLESGESRTISGILRDLRYPTRDLHSAEPPSYDELAALLTIVVESGDDRHLIGGWGAVWEDIEAERIVLHASDVVLQPSSGDLSGDRGKLSGRW